MAGAIGGLAHKTLVSDFRHIDPKQARIVLVEVLPRILIAFPESLANKAHKALNRLGVEVRTSSPVEAIDSEGVVIARELLAAKTVIWTAGVAATPAGQWLGAETDRAGRVKVGSDLTVPDHPNMFVIYVDKGNLVTIGRFYGIAAIGKLRFAGLLGWFVWLVVHLIFLIGYRNRLVVMFQWAVYYMTFQRGARLITIEDKPRLN